MNNVSIRTQKINIQIFNTPKEQQQKNVPLQQQADKNNSTKKTYEELLHFLYKLKLFRHCPEKKKKKKKRKKKNPLSSSFLQLAKHYIIFIFIRSSHINIPRHFNVILLKRFQQIFQDMLQLKKCPAASQHCHKLWP